ncbi:hypothetical protein CEXT_387991 [Caerostris extrusa]|uniref:Uncharacterized protein n=1 Tax=Caerostris extrusa TaxID=172846 RepID=A0AAV4WAT5_CAEEX|nr:hypothetical protein CEXT_387991 [Caerostris extrusa]
MLLQTGVSLSQFLGSMGNCGEYFQNFPYLLACGEKRWVRLLQQRLEAFHSRSLFFNVFVSSSKSKAAQEKREAGKENILSRPNQQGKREKKKLENLSAYCCGHRLIKAQGIPI